MSQVRAFDELRRRSTIPHPFVQRHELERLVIETRKDGASVWPRYRNSIGKRYLDGRPGVLGLHHGRDRRLRSPLCPVASRFGSVQFAQASPPTPEPQALVVGIVVLGWHRFRQSRDLDCVPRGSFDVGVRGESIDAGAGKRPIVLRNLALSIVTTAIGAFKVLVWNGGSRKRR